ncbi:hypothetical protein LWI29_034191 [Acer saccharum]|uniref:Potassium transporter n=1 Tax=Acer saccharum TaxID=4024 RepID=A0AA39RLK1_ACESA|nr:hypothetical protein LWI29_034191 [Acer saccharum]
MSGDEEKDHTEESLHGVAYEGPKGRKNSRNLLRRYDSLDMESGMVSGHQLHGRKVLNWSIVLQLAFQSIGVVYGDLGTSPLYVFPGTFQNGVKHVDDILGVVSLILYTITLIPLINYVFIVLRATDRGDGGTFALYSLICRYAKVGLIPNQQAEDSNVSNFNLVLPGNDRRQRRAEAFKSKLENSQFAKVSLLLAALLGTSLVIGDGIITPCISGPLYWPMFVVAVLAAIIASQALISGAFSVIQQSLALGCFPRVKVVHTSAKYEGQVFIPEINYLLMLACVGVTLGFKTTEKMGNAYGMAVVFVMTLTSILLVLVMIIIWKSSLSFIISYVLIIGSVELIYLSAVMYKFDQGGYLPLAFSAILITVMYVWNNVYRRKYYYELKNKVSHQRLMEIAADTSLCRIPGLAMFYSELVHGVPPIFKQYVANVPALHSVIVFVSMKSLPISKVPSEERFIFRRVEPKELNIFRCVARYGYTDVHDMDGPLELVLVENLKEFIRGDYGSSQTITNGGESPEAGMESLAEYEDTIQEEKIEESSIEGEIEIVEKAWRAGVVHLIGESEVVAAEGAGIGTRVMINYAYNFMKRNLRHYDKLYDRIPHRSMLKVGMTYEL